MNATRFASHVALPGLELNICQGRSLFIPGLTYRAGVSGSGQGRDLFRGNANFGLFKASAYAGYNFRLGICGPAWAGTFVASQEELNGQQYLSLQRNHSYLSPDDKDAFAGGFFAGATLFIGLNVGIDVFCGISVKCRRWKCTTSWRYCGVGGFNVGVNVDLIAIMAMLADFDTNWGVPGYGSSIDMTDTGYGLLQKTGWSASLKPEFLVTFNLLNLIKPIKAFNDSMGRYGTGVELGPFFSITFPITFKLTHFARNSNGLKTYSVQASRDSNDRIPITELVNNHVLGNPGTNRAVVRIEWRISTTFQIGIIGGFRVLWAIYIGVRVGFPVGNLIPALRLGGISFATNLISNIGSTANTAAIAALPAGEDCGCEEPIVAETTPRFTFAALEAQPA
jgi:hypothetical protein